ncbi:hypothetical protein AAVH_39995 [Aphelenchoides avenae]|nr:hypothetical protein AAVH_39995 [Aphelenchus avenae]
MHSILPNASDDHDHIDVYHDNSADDYGYHSAPSPYYAHNNRDAHEYVYNIDGTQQYAHHRTYHYNDVDDIVYCNDVLDRPPAAVYSVLHNNHHDHVYHNRDAHDYVNDYNHARHWVSHINDAHGHLYRSYDAHHCA